MYSLYFVIAISFNAASLKSTWDGGAAFTTTDPAPASLMLLVMWLLLAASSRRPRVHGALCAFAAASLSWGGAWSHIRERHVYEAAEAFHDTHWRNAVAINAFGALSLLQRAVDPQRRRGAAAATCLLVAGGIVTIARRSTNRTLADLCSDAPFFDPPELAVPHLPFQRLSQYVPMSDGVELAVDIYLPNGFAPGAEAPLPTFLHLTRYHRAEERSLLSRFVSLFGHPPNPDGVFPMRSLHYLNSFVPSGYAFVSVDVRGTGASFGSRPIDLIDREVLDFKEIAVWTKAQPFCNGRIGTGGISYDGITGALMAAQGNIAAAALLFAPGDIFEDIAFVGGIPTIGFVDMYGKFTTASEKNLPVNDVDNELPLAFKAISNYAFRGVAPVRGAEHRLPQAVAEHKDNFDMLAKVRDPSVRTKDSTLVRTEARDKVEHTARDIGIGASTYEGLARHGVAVYSVAGYFDSGSVRSAARLHNYLVRKGGAKKSKLTIGPWSHGARAAWTPTSSSTVPQFPLFADVKRFFDCQLKDQCTDDASHGNNVGDKSPAGVADEPLLHYFLSGPDQWHTGTGEWPPDDLTMTMFELASFTAATGKATTGKTGSSVLSFDIDFSATTGLLSRWNLVQHLMKKAITYPDRAAQAEKGLVFEWHKPLPKDGLVIVGSPVVALSLALGGNATDAAVFVYLEEADPVTGATNYITEGALRVSHRATPRCKKEVARPGALDSVHRTYSDKDMAALTPGEFNTVEIVLEPIAYVVPSHHTLRVVLAGADADNFYLGSIPNLARKWMIKAGDSELRVPTLRN